MEKKNESINDYLGFAKDNEIHQIINDEVLMFSDKIQKINRYRIHQERNILITDKAIYNLKKKELKRKIPFTDILGITISKISDEFVIHGTDDEYDYDYISLKRREILIAINTSYGLFNNGKKIPLCLIAEKSLKNYVTLKKEKKKDVTFSRMGKDIIDITYFISSTTPLSNGSNKGGDGAGLVSNTSRVSSDARKEDFKTLKVLGRGTFGKVCLVNHVPSGKKYAMKSLKKHVLLENDQLKNTLLEKEILETIDHPLLCCLVYSFQNEQRLYFVMPFLDGGELFQHLRRVKHYEEDTGKFYTAQIALGLQYLHDKNIIYRDLKTENILMDNKGYLKLADFGMAKKLKNNEKAMTFCGTPEYIAPEIIVGKGHDYNADWWSFGILLYELLTGNVPFFNSNNDILYKMITEGQFNFPKKIPLSEDAKDIITKLLIKDPNSRLGSKRGIEEIKEHPFFASIDFQALLDKKITAPFIPRVENIEENFDKQFTEETVEESLIPENQMKNVKKQQKVFKVFDSK